MRRGDSLISTLGHLGHSARVGVSFGLTSGIITTLGLIVGLSRGTGSKTAVLAGVITIAVADSLSDAMGIHMSEEAEGVHDVRQIWTSTISTFIAKLIMALTFTLPILFLPIDLAVLVAVMWGAVAITLLSFGQARARTASPLPIVVEHLLIVCVVVVAAHLLGLGISAAVGRG